MSDFTGIVRPYSALVSLMSQTGTAAPTVSNLENTIGASTPVIRLGAGIYSIETTIPIEDLAKVHVLGFASPYTSGTGALPITDEGSITGWVLFTLGSTFAVTVSILIYVYDDTFASVDLGGLIGNGALCLPEVRYYLS